ncbi:MAG TPA: hypothetical protein VJX67_25320 [Blastocatellia bacterium]|nr:hypothetical protein [Blastocatellia bacterium]
MMELRDFIRGTKSEGFRAAEQKWKEAFLSAFAAGIHRRYAALRQEAETAGDCTSLARAAQGVRDFVQENFEGIADAVPPDAPDSGNADAINSGLRATATIDLTTNALNPKPAGGLLN